MPSNIYQPHHSTIELNARTGDRGMDAAIYVNTNESLQVSITSSIGRNVPPGTGFTGVSVNVDVRMLTVNNGLQYLTFTFNPPNDYSTQTFQIKVPEGLLLNLSAYTTGMVIQVAGGLSATPLLGQTWVNLSLVAPIQPNKYMATYLTQGYVTNQERVVYPPQQTISYQDGYPFLRPAGPIVPIGTGYQVQPNAINEITCVFFSVSTDAAVTQRQVYLSIYMNLQQTVPATNRVVTIPFQTLQGPSTFQNYEAWIGAPNYSTSSLATFATLPLRLRLKAGDYIQPGLSAADPGDSVSNLCVWGNEWLVP